MTEEKPVAPNPEEELEALDDLEKRFQHVVSSLVSDKSLTGFRVEYEKIQEALLQSHANNSELVK
jgi:hypothetical protein